jgi:thiosulfate reductase cytochrome b subunit
MDNAMQNGSATFYLYTRYERFWHWLQTALILALLVTGLEVHGSFTLLGFKRAATIHSFLGLTWLIAFAFFVFWLFTTGEWKQYVPTSKKMLDVARYYLYGIFIGAPHPCPKRPDAKHNPLQRLTYLSLAALLLPLQMASGLLYYTYNSWKDYGLDFLDLSAVALVHLLLAFGLIVYIIVHVYMTTTGHTLFAHIKAMVTGWEVVSRPEAVDEWEKKAR